MVARTPTPGNIIMHVAWVDPDDEDAKSTAKRMTAAYRKAIEITGGGDANGALIHAVQRLVAESLPGNSVTADEALIIIDEGLVTIQ